ncbi:hypothetical protein [Arthrobacter sp. zg-Y769]|uniref:hypothetical protein n=1 Tax=Arthrobacter sp. zg-Y769 TaxID=2894191 RepID=UPI001E3EDC5A|nr:hypothetical protein [Arthrobacter sp. zg-Y769]MCC9204569.1 hypothetical protein [Arthrobacter sp. zg-Y769]
MTDHINHRHARWILHAITIVGVAVAAVCYSYLISSNCGSSGANEFFSDARAFHSQAGC